MLNGVAASPGIGIGKALLIKDEEIKVERNTVNYLEAEKRRYLDAVEVFVAEIERNYELMIRNISESEAAILSAQIGIIRDPELTKEVLRSIERQRVNAEYVFSSICNGYVALFSNLEDELMRARAADFLDIKNRMLSILMGLPYIDISTIPPDSILVAEDIPPSQAALIDPNRVQAILTQDGTRFSHVSIIARALQLPAVVAADGLLDLVNGGEVLIVDGDSGKAYINPDEAELQDYRVRMLAAKQRRANLESYRAQPTRTMDGAPIKLSANLAIPQELASIRENNADGIGLFRTEFLYMERKKPPAESEQFEVYRNVVQAMEGRTVVIRTLDVGGDKKIPYLIRETEDNPFLGYRAIRYCLNNRALFKNQLSAILRAAAFGNVLLLLPMIASVEEVRAVRALIGEVADELAVTGRPFRADVPVGAMIETPAAVMCIDQLAGACDFFSIGTNDLTQYTLAVDRCNDNVSYLYSDRHPAVLRMVKLAVEAAGRAGIPISVCGEAAGDPVLLPFLIGLGVTRFSVASGALLPVRSQINNLSRAFWRERLPEILALETPGQVTAYIEGQSAEIIV